MNFKSFRENLIYTQMLRKMQYFSDQEGIIRRYIQEKNNWDLHLKKSKDFILKSAETKKKGKVVILGSGWLLDLPIDELSNQFKEVILVDIIHPKQILHKIKKYKNVTTLKADITGGLIDFIYHSLKTDKRKKQKTLISAANSFSFSLPKNTDFVISLNIMCQLHIILIDYIKKYYNLTDSELHNLILQIQQSHIRMLPEEKSCIITDMEEEILTETNQTIGIKPLVQINLPKGNFSSSWQWKFDSLMTYKDDVKTFFNTTAIDF
jgi:hypothetical protein